MDRQEFTQIVVPLYRRMFAVALRILSDADMASDAVQECFDKLYRRRDVLDSVDSIEAYCMTAVRHEALTVLRGCRTSPVINDVYPVAADDSDRVVDCDSLNYVMSLIERLPQTQREVLTMSAIDEYDNDRIAEMTGLSQSNIRQLLSRARKKLKSMYHNRGL